MWEKNDFSSQIELYELDEKNQRQEISLNKGKTWFASVPADGSVNYQIIPMTQVADDHIDLRRGIDHIGVTVCVLVHDGEGNLLLMKRGPKARDENGRWDIVGGALEFGEKITDAVKREMAEELCTDPEEVEYHFTIMSTFLAILKA